MVFVARRAAVLGATALFLRVAVAAYSQQPALVRELSYDPQTGGPVPIPASERGLQTVMAAPWFKVSFDADGNLLFADVSGGRVLRLTPEKRLSTAVELNKLAPGGLAMHQDGRIFIAAMNMATKTGSIVAVKSDGTGMQTIVPSAPGFMPNDNGRC